MRDSGWELTIFTIGLQFIMYYMSIHNIGVNKYNRQLIKFLAK